MVEMEKQLQNQLMELTDTSIPEWIDDYAKIGIDKQGMWFVLTANYEHQIDRIKRSCPSDSCGWTNTSGKV